MTHPCSLQIVAGALFLVGALLALFNLIRCRPCMLACTHADMHAFVYAVPIRKRGMQQAVGFAHM